MTLLKQPKKGHIETTSESVIEAKHLAHFDALKQLKRSSSEIR
jgi:hypothetical protein